MSARTKRSMQKELRQPDEFVTATGRVVEWGRRNQQAVVLTAIGLVVVLVLLGLWSWWDGVRQDRATNQFYAAIELYRAEQWQEAYDGFVALSEDLPASAYGRLALLYAGRSALQRDQPGEAVKSYRAFLASDEGSATLQQLARLNLGRALVETKDLGGARKEFAEALEQAGPARAAAALELAQVEAASSNRARALELFQQYLEDAPDGPGVQLARAQILALGGSLPTPNLPQGLPPGLQIRQQ